MPTRTISAPLLPARRTPGNGRHFPKLGFAGQAALLLSVAGWTAPWLAAQTPAYYEIINRKSQASLDVTNASTSNGALIQQWAYWGGIQQQWQLVAVGNYYKIVNQNSGKVLDVTNASTSDGALIQQWADSGAVQQQWQLVALSDPDTGYYEIVNPNSRKALEVQDGSLSNGALILQGTTWAAGTSIGR
jgi:hypothetical protein